MQGTGGKVVHFERVCPPGSQHQGGYHAQMCDGAIKFINDSIEACNFGSPHVAPGAAGLLPGSANPFGLRGALGTKLSRETIDVEL
jgi:hypothetical protein